MMYVVLIYFCDLHVDGGTIIKTEVVFILAIYVRRSS